MIQFIVSSTKTQDKVQGAFLLNVVIAEGATILELLASEDQTLLIWRDTLFVLNLGFDIID
jgi:hypothetical protein